MTPSFFVSFLKDKNDKYTYGLVSILLFLLFTAYLKLFDHENLVRFDEAIITEPLKKIISLPQYLGNIWGGQLADLQPIRDLSYFANFPFESYFPQIYLFSNFIVFAFILWVAQKIFFRLIGAHGQTLIWMCAFALHPIFSQTVPWIAARKHLLSVLFILLAQEQLPLFANHMRHISGWIKITLYYLLSTLSNPITLLWPGSNFIQSLIKKEKLRGWIPLLIVMFFIAGINYYYYSYVFIKLSQTQKILAFSGVAPILNALGRNFFQIVFPIKMAFSYDPESLCNLIGISLLVFWHSVIIKRLDQQEVCFILGLFWPTQLITNFIPTFIFVSDTYLLLPLFAFFCSCILLTKKIPSRAIIIGVSCLSLLLFCKTYPSINRWSDSKTFWEMSYHEEDSCINLIWHTNEKWRASEITEALAKGREMLARRCYQSGTEYHRTAMNIYILCILNEPGLGLAQKENQLSKIQLSDQWRKFFSQLLRIETLRDDKFRSLLQEAANLKLAYEDPLLHKARERCVGPTINFSCQQLFSSH
ncbi:MAG: hypothetical protein HYV97_14285 [Bdellovibrio sp.]|nr:hypothetical protein [Bdellovibrio sp.]